MDKFSAIYQEATSKILMIQFRKLESFEGEWGNQTAVARGRILQK